jgi:hypothetical protein
MTPPLPASLIDKVAGVAVETHYVEDVAPWARAGARDGADRG